MDTGLAKSFAGKADVRDDPEVDGSEIQTAFDDVFDQAVVFHGFADYARDYDVFVYVTADPRLGIAPLHVRYRFKNCVRVLALSALSPQIWKQSLDERLVDYERGRDLDGYIWGVKWQGLCPGMRLVEDSADARHWSRDVGLLFYEATIEMDGHNISLIFSDLVVDIVGAGYAPFVVPDGGPDFKIPIL
ncbi:hypothetical protein [Dactylosporangium sp. NPDC048998]|uniref:YxiG-like protein n=1 Tax=Dactylosporangium sp. NPDC048998 TaxID=3363976 RepID=UPI00371AC313